MSGLRHQSQKQMVVGSNPSEGGGVDSPSLWPMRMYDHDDDDHHHLHDCLCEKQPRPQEFHSILHWRMNEEYLFKWKKLLSPSRRRSRDSWLGLRNLQFTLWRWNLLQIEELSWKPKLFADQSMHNYRESGFSDLCAQWAKNGKIVQ